MRASSWHDSCRNWSMLDNSDQLQHGQREELLLLRPITRLPAASYRDGRTVWKFSEYPSAAWSHTSVASNAKVLLRIRSTSLLPCASCQRTPWWLSLTWPLLESSVRLFESLPRTPRCQRGTPQSSGCVELWQSNFEQLFLTLHCLIVIIRISSDEISCSVIPMSQKVSPSRSTSLSFPPTTVRG